MARISKKQQEALDSDEACCDYLKSKTLAKRSVKAVTFCVLLFLLSFSLILDLPFLSRPSFGFWFLPHSFHYMNVYKVDTYTIHFAQTQLQYLQLW